MTMCNVGRMLMSISNMLIAGATSCGLPGDVSDDAARIGISPERLAVAGFTATDAQTILARLAGATGQRLALHDAEEAAAAAARQLAAAALTAKADPWNQTTAAQVTAARAALQQASALVDQRRHGLELAALDGFAESKVTNLQACAASGATSLPLSLRLVAQSDNARRALAAAVNSENRAVRLGVSVPADAAATLAAARSLPAVIAAETSLINARGPIAAVFEQY